jgi:DNA-binding MarR family transcriptional regulator
MSRSPKQAKNARQPPYIGALLRMSYQVTRQRQLEAQRQHGHTDLNQALLSVLVYPAPDGVRPSDLADRTFMTKQAMNHLLGQLEALGYVERRAEKGRNRRLVYLTRRGWDVFETQWAAMQDLEREWAIVLGKKRFNELLSSLRELAVLNSKSGIAESPRQMNRSR